MMTLQLVSRRVFIVSIFWSIFGVTNKTNKEKKKETSTTNSEQSEFEKISDHNTVGKSQKKPLETLFSIPKPITLYPPLLDQPP